KGLVAWFLENLRVVVKRVIGEYKPHLMATNVVEAEQLRVGDVIVRFLLDQYLVHTKIGFKDPRLGLENLVDASIHVPTKQDHARAVERKKAARRQANGGEAPERRQRQPK